MKYPIKWPRPILAGGLIALGLMLPACALVNPAPISAAAYGPAIVWYDVTLIQITNPQGERLGRVDDLVLDLSNGRVVEMLVKSGQTLGFGGKLIAVPPLALLPDFPKQRFIINMSPAAFLAAPAFNSSQWAASTQPDRVAATYRYFGVEPHFLLAGETPGRTTAAGRVVTNLGILEKMSDLINMPVVNLQGVWLGRLGSLTLDVPAGRIVSAFIRSHVSDRPELPNQYLAVVPPMLLSFNAKHDGLVLDVSKIVLREEPRVVFQDSVGGQARSYREQNASGPPTTADLAQGASFRDVRITAQIYQAIQDAKLDPDETVQAGTLDGRVTLRGSVRDQETQNRIGTIAVALVRVENVDNQIVVEGAPPSAP